MSKIWEFFDTMEEIVYVSDINSHELIYMNQKALRTYGFRSLEEITHKKCYEVLQNCSAPCSMCNNHKLKQGSFMEWWYYNPFLEKQVMLKDTLVEENGKKYRMELAIDSDRQELLDKLKKMGYLDQLTQIGNRHAMSEYIDNLQNEQSLGIVYCDVTGLKQVNDQKGHAFGDQLIIDACEGLKKIFGEYGLFRIGGDELLALCTEIDESALWQGVEQLKQDLQNNSIHVAIGGLWEKDSFGGVDRLIAEAERKMYQDKAAYYKKHGFDRRHSQETIINWMQSRIYYDYN